MNESDELKFAAKVADEYTAQSSRYFTNELALEKARLSALVSIARSLESISGNGIETMIRDD